MSELSPRGKKVVAPRGRGRRSQAERDQILQAERERTKAREIEYAREQAAKTAAERRRQELERTSRGGHRRLGRGGYMGDKNASAPTGPFSAGSVFQPAAKVGKAYPRPWAPSKRPSSGSRVKVENETQQDISRLEPSFSDVIDDGTNVKPEDGGYISSDPDEAGEGARKDVDFINLISDDENDGEDGAGRPSSPALVPVRIQRVEHKGRAIHVNTEASSTVKQQDSEGETVMEEMPAKASRKGKQRTKDTDTLSTQRRWRGVYDDEEDIEMHEDDQQSQPPAAAPKPSMSSEKTRRKQPTFDETTVFQTEEDRQEHDRGQRQLDILREELGDVSLDGDSQGDQQDQRADRVYVFQFPSKLPDLINASAAVKEEPSSPLALAADAPTGAPAAPIKIEDDGPLSMSRASTFGSGRAAQRPSTTPGLMGKLRIHKSGKATLDWGGTSLQVSKGLDESMLQDVVVVRPLGGQTGAEGYGSGAGTDVGGEALAFGQVRGKFVVTPDWGELWG